MLMCKINNCKSKKRETTLFKIPADPLKRKKWIKLIEKYQPFDYNTQKYVMCVECVKKLLQTNDVPSIFPNVEEIKTDEVCEEDIPIQKNELKRCLPMQQNDGEQSSPLVKVIKLESNEHNISTVNDSHVKLVDIESIKKKPIEKPLLWKRVILKKPVENRLLVVQKIDSSEKVANRLPTISKTVSLANVSVPTSGTQQLRILKRIIKPTVATGTATVKIGLPSTPKPTPKLTVTPITTLTNVKNTTITTKTPSTFENVKICAKCVKLDTDLQIANKTINSLNETVSRLTNELKLLKGDVQPNDIEKKVKNCKLCGVWLKSEDIDSHICIPLECLSCKYCPDKFKSTNKFMAHLSLADHVKKIEIDAKAKQFFNCDQCTFAFPMSIQLDCHKISHSKIKPERSKEVIEKNNATKLKNNGRAPLKLFRCGRCDMSFNTPSELAKHMQIFKISYAQLPNPITDQNATFECYLCKKSHCIDLNSLLNHMKVVHCEKKLEIRNKVRFKNVQCKICLEYFTNDEIHEHLCGNETSIDCEYCDESFQSILKLMKHFELIHDDNKKLYRCEKCRKFFPSLILKKLHLNYHKSGQKLFMCCICSEIFSDKEQLNAHERKHKLKEKKNSVKKFENVNDEDDTEHLCEECGKTFKTLTYLRKHMQTHSGPSYQCPDCPRTFYVRTNLKRHSRVHSNTKYVCEICQNESKSENGYERHMKIHTRTEADRKHECEICSRKFFSKKNLKKHIMMHTEKRRFECQYCNVTYKWKGDLNKHLRTHITDGKIHECDKCSLSFYYPDELQKHLFDHYKEDKEKKQQQEKQQQEQRHKDKLKR